MRGYGFLTIWFCQWSNMKYPTFCFNELRYEFSTPLKTWNSLCFPDFLTHFPTLPDFVSQFPTFSIPWRIEIWFLTFSRCCLLVGTLDKLGDMSDNNNNYRGTSLISATAKVYDLILIQWYQVTNYIVRLCMNVIVVTNTATRRTNKA